MNLAGHIKDLLFQEDCVIIPGFGGFVCKYKEAKIDFSTSRIIPPARIVAFNQQLKENDGLLIQFCAKQENKDYTVIESKIKAKVTEINEMLKKGESVDFKDIGRFKIENQNLVFKPVSNQNFNLDSYGMESFEFPMLSSQTKLVPTRKKQLEPVKKKNRKPSLVPLLIGIPLLAAISYLPIYFQSNPIQQKTETAGITLPVNLVKIEPQAQEIIIPRQVLSLEENDNSSSDVLTTEANKEYPEVAEPIVNTNTNENISTIGNSEFNIHIIAGSFSSYANAEKSALDYQAQSYKVVILPAANGMHRVSIQQYSTKENAILELSQLKEATKNPNLWILKD
jgi:nucleoid DNA-binding protein